MPKSQITWLWSDIGILTLWYVGGGRETGSLFLLKSKVTWLKNATNNLGVVCPLHKTNVKINSIVSKFNVTLVRSAYQSSDVEKSMSPQADFLAL